MPARIVDGDALWRSKKLKKVPARFRSEYANLLPLAEANGVFECDPDRVWADVYSFNRPEITPDIVGEILDEMERADLLRRWKPNGKIYGYWVGIEKTGRLPSESHVKRYKNLPPNPPREFTSDNLSRIIPDNPGTCPEGLVLDWIGMDRIGEPEREETEKPGQEEDVKATKQIPILCQTILGVKAKLYPEQTAMIQALEAEHKGSAVINAFSEWALEHRHDGIRSPVAAFLREAEDLLGGSPARAVAKTPEVQNLARELSYLSKGEIQFDDRHKGRLAEHLSSGFSVEEITSAFKEFYGNLDKTDAGEMKFAAKKFSETADQLAYAAGRRKKEAAAQSALMESEKLRLEREAAEERAKRVAEQAAEVVEDTLEWG